MKLNLIEPTLLLDKKKALANMDKILRKVRQNGSAFQFRPHFKTHQSHEVGRWFRQKGIEAITVSSLKMAEYFAADGWRDITVAFPVNILEMERINQLASQIRLNLVVENEDAIGFLRQNLQSPVSIFLKIDAGYHRTGIPVEDAISIRRLLEEMTLIANLNFVGFLIHSGHSYQAVSKEEILTVHEDCKTKVLTLKTYFQPDYPDLLISVGDTPTCSVAEDFSFADEIRPGNFIFYDVMQAKIGSCSLSEIAVAMACPVVAKHAQRNEIIVYGGGVHLSKDRSRLPNGKPFFGYLAILSENPINGWRILPTENYVQSLSQEHGKLKVTDAVFSETNIGDVMLILPIHSCMAADLMRAYMTLEGKKIAAAN